MVLKGIYFKFLASSNNIIKSAEIINGSEKKYHHLMIKFLIKKR